MAKGIIGIDLGTSTSEIAFFEAGEAKCVPDPQSRYKSPVVPSIVAVDKRGDIRVGWRGEPHWGDPKAHVREVKRLMGTEESVSLGGKRYRPEEISAHILSHIKAMAEERLGHEIHEVVVSVPAYFESAAKTSTRVAAEIAGLKVLRLINEPTAAALAFGVKNVDLEAQVLVFDFGGGTLDVTVLEMMEGILDVKASFGDTKLGGKDFDALLMDFLVEEVRRQHPGAQLGEKAPAQMKRAAEDLKIALSRDRTANSVVPFIAQKNGEPIDLEVELTREKFNHLISPLLNRARKCVERALEAGKVRSSQIDKVLLVGGTTYIPAVRELVAEVFGKEPKAEISPDLAVVMGAAIHAASAAGELSAEKDIILSDVCPMGLGIDMVSDVGGRLALTYEPLIKINQKIPYMVRKEYSLLRPDQREVEFRLYQDHDGNAKFPEDAIPTGVEGVITDIPPALYGTPHPLHVEFSYDINGEIRVKASIPGLSRDCTICFSNSSIRMTSDQVAEAQLRMAGEGTSEGLWKSHPRASELAPLLAKADKYLASIPPRERSPLAEVVSAAKTAMATGQDTRIEELRNQLVQTLFNLEEP